MFYYYLKGDNMKKLVKLNFKRVDFVCIKDATINYETESQIGDFTILISSKNYYYDSKLEKIRFKTGNNLFVYVVDSLGRCLHGGTCSDLSSINRILTEKTNSFFDEHFDIDSENKRIAAYQQSVSETKDRIQKRKDAQKEKEKEEEERIETILSRILSGEAITVDNDEFEKVCKAAGIKITAGTLGSLRKNVSKINIDNKKIAGMRIRKGKQCKGIYAVSF